MFFEMIKCWGNCKCIFELHLGIKTDVGEPPKKAFHISIAFLCVITK